MFVDTLATVENGWLDAVEAYVGDTGDPRPLRDWLDRHGLEPARLDRMPQWSTIKAEAVGRTGGARHTDTHVDNWVARAVHAAAAIPGGNVVLTLYIAAVCAEALERSYHHDRILTVITAAQRAVRVADEITPAVLRQLDSLRYEIEVERALICAAPMACVRPAEQVLVVARRAQADATALASICPPIARYLGRLATARTAYYRGVVAAARAVAGYEVSGRAALPKLRRAIEVLREAEGSDAVNQTADTSELRAHRRSLQRLADAAGEEWLVVEQGKIVYVYPFAVRGAPDALVVQAARRHGRGWTLAGQPVRWMRDFLPIDDTWEGATRRRYDGLVLELPDLIVTTADGKARGPFRVELRFSNLGNHYLRVETALNGARPPDLYEYLHRAAPEHGLETLTGVGEPVNLAGHVGAILRHLGQRLVLAIADDPQLRDPLEQAGRPLSRVVVQARPDLFHVVVSVWDASLAAGPGADAPRVRAGGVGELRHAVGWPVLCHPVPEATYALAEWSRYSPSATRNALHGLTLASEHVMATLNTTVLVMLGTPTFMITPLETMAEFTASLEGLIGAWRGRIAEYRRKLVEAMDQAELAVATGRQDGVAANLREIQNQQLVLQRLVAEAQSLLMHLFGPTLVSTEVQREILDRLAEATGVNRLRADLHEQLDQASSGRAEAVIDALARVHEQRTREAAARRDNRQRIVVEAFAWVFGAGSLSGVIQVLQDAAWLSHAESVRWSLGTLALGGAGCVRALVRMFRY
ncbi:hypothetical protein [Longispora albida]|uniref:hypothetical protein n=1 Tax=Longispora albida TaxID=203523 RepID=UPI0004780FC8|nr:hypothetical protein [Longispora albida]